MMALFISWIGKQGEYTVTYANDFGIVDVAQEIATAQAVIDLGLTDDMKAEVAKKVITAYLPDISDTDYDALIKSVQQNIRDKELNAPQNKLGAYKWI